MVTGILFEIAPSNWSTDDYPTGGGDVTLGNGGLGQSNAPTNLDRSVRTGASVGEIILNSLTIQATGGLNMEFGTKLTADTFNFQGNDDNDTTLTVGGGGGAWPVVVLPAGGSMRKTTGTSTFMLYSGIVLRVDNGGTIASDAGALQLSGNGTRYAGGVNFNAATGALIDVAPANATDSATVLFTGPVAGINTGGTVRLNKGWIGTVSGTGGTTFNFGGDTFQWQGGAIRSTAADPFINAGTINVTGTPALLGNGFTNQGTIIQSGPGVLNLPYGTAFTNAPTGIFDLRNDLGLTLIGGGGGRPPFTNAGTFQKSISSGTATIDPDFVNAGTILVSSGTLQFSHFHQTGGIMDLNGGDISSGNDIVLDGGSLTGSGTIMGTVRNNSGTVVPGHSPGTISISGNYSQGASGTLNLEIGGRTAGTQFDQLAVAGQASLSGTLNVTLINGFRPNVGDVFQIIPNGSFSGAFAAVNTTGFTGQVNYAAGAITITVLTVPDIPLNIATRLRVNPDPNQLIGGVIITGTEPKKVLIRAIGPSLSSFFSGALADPTLELYQGSTLLESNDNWRDTNQTAIEATGIAPTNDLESAILRTVAPGAYTAIVRGKAGSSGIGLVEVYDLDQTAKSKLANIATRGFVDTDDNVMIGGFIVGGNGQANGRAVIRAIGPSLGAVGITNALQDPTLELHDANGSTLMVNDDWQSSQQAEIEATGLAPTDVRESAMVTSLPDGNYTAIVRGKNNTTGVAVVEVYSVL